MSEQPQHALIVIDLQNDYFEGGSYPLWNSQITLENTEAAIQLANERGIPVLVVQHIANTSNGAAPFFNEGTDGVEVHPRILAAAPGGRKVIKNAADSFVGTTLEETLTELGITDLMICGMMTQNCVTHTAISKSAEKYRVSVLEDCCATVDAMINAMALKALSLRLPMISVSDGGLSKAWG